MILSRLPRVLAMGSPIAGVSSARFISSLYVQYEPNVEVRRRVEDKFYSVVEKMRASGIDVKNCYFPKKGSHTSGICFVYFPSSVTPEEVEKAIKKFNGHVVDEETSVLAMKSNKHDSIYLGLKVDFNISRVRHEDKLIETFKKFGKIVQVSLPRTKGLGVPLGYGFVTFERDEDAQAAQAAMNGQMGWKNFNLDILKAKGVQTQKEK